MALTGLPFPVPDPNWAPLAPLWTAAARREFRLPRCAACGTFDWYPTGSCRTCAGDRIDWVRLSGRGSLFSWSIVRRALEPPLAPLQPYVSAIIAIEEDPRTRFVSRLIDADPARLSGDSPVEVRFADLGYPVLTTNVLAPLFVLRDAL